MSSKFQHKNWFKKISTDWFFVNRNIWKTEISTSFIDGKGTMLTPTFPTNWLENTLLKGDPTIFSSFMGKKNLLNTKRIDSLFSPSFHHRLSCHSWSFKYLNLTNCKHWFWSNMKHYCRRKTFYIYVKCVTYDNSIFYSTLSF